ncbi:MAG TPA: PIG-L family deacetylase [Opitutaceae bacterium]|nr:PIG-L family deacetylase [Opitutaceae bacterium]
MPETPVDILAFGAHPDDVEFGCGGVIASEVQHGMRARLVVCSRGESATNGTPNGRSSEAEQGAGALGAELEFIDLGGDAHFEHRAEHVIALAAVIRRHRPRIVFSPTSAENQHPDHVVLARLIRDAARLARYGGVAELRGNEPHAIEQLLGYAVSMEGEPAGQTPLFYDVSAESVMASWRASMEAHASQMRTRNYVELQLTRARLNGLRSGVGNAIALFPNDPIVVSSLAHLGRSARRF